MWLYRSVGFAGYRPFVIRRSMPEWRLDSPQNLRILQIVIQIPTAPLIHCPPITRQLLEILNRVAIRARTVLIFYPPWWQRFCRLNEFRPGADSLLVDQWLCIFAAVSALILFAISLRKHSTQLQQLNCFPQYVQFLMLYDREWDYLIIIVRDQPWSASSAPRKLPFRVNNVISCILIASTGYSNFCYLWEVNMIPKKQQSDK